MKNPSVPAKAFTTWELSKFKIMRDMAIVARVFGDDMLERKVNIKFRAHLEVPRLCNPQEFVDTLRMFYDEVPVVDSGLHKGFRLRLAEAAWTYMATKELWSSVSELLGASRAQLGKDLFDMRAVMIAYEAEDLGDGETVEADEGGDIDNDGNGDMH